MDNNSNEDVGCGCGCLLLIIVIIVMFPAVLPVALIIISVIVAAGVAIGRNRNNTGSSASGSFDSQNGDRVFSENTDDTTVTCSIMRLVGYVARANKVITRDEINSAENIIAKLGAEHRQLFIKAFQTGKSRDYSPEEDLVLIRAIHGRDHDKCLTIIAILVYIAVANGSISPEERRRIGVVASALNVSYSEAEEIIREMGDYSRRQEQSRRDNTSAGTVSEYQTALNILGVSESTSADDITRAYRKLIRKYHPDLAKGKGLPESMVAVYENKTKEINEAYDLVRKYRKF
ncbi:DnaJ domain-containing protein [Succinimonas amylolytica]|uniref:DnaJ domain-containing protein n=1 Tax=Succinimonas amylolytica TaxID=83769 RepID=UPI0023A87C1E